MSRRARPRLALLAVVATGAWMVPNDGGAQEAAPAGAFVLDYDIPESPAFAALGATPHDVLTASAAKPVAAHILNQLIAGGEAEPGVALDIAPYFLYAGRFESVADYRRDRWRRMLANLTLSAGTVEASDPAADLRFGAGARLTLWDSHDLLADPELARGIDEALARLADARGVAAGGDDEVEVVDLSDRGGDLAEVYAAARQRVRNSRGSALSIGWGVAGILRGRILAADSVADERHRLWAAFRYSLGNGNDLMAVTQWVQGGDERDATLAGIALRNNGPDVRFTGELLYNSGSRRLEPALSAEIRALQGVHLIAGLQSVPTATGEQRLTLHTQLGWAMSEER